MLYNQKGFAHIFLFLIFLLIFLGVIIIFYFFSKSSKEYVRDFSSNNLSRSVNLKKTDPFKDSEKANLWYIKLSYDPLKKLISQKGIISASQHHSSLLVKKPNKEVYESIFLVEQKGYMGELIDKGWVVSNKKLQLEQDSFNINFYVTNEFPSVVYLYSESNQLLWVGKLTKFK